MATQSSIMKSLSLLLLCVVTLESCLAFLPTLHHSMVVRDTCLSASRRNFLDVAGAAGFFVGPMSAFAEPRPTYLTEPTDEFKQNEAKAAEFKRQQLLAKKDFIVALDKLTSESNDADALVKDLKDIQALVAKTGGLPLGIKKEELYKIIRSKKAKGFWPTPVEVA